MASEILELPVEIMLPMFYKAEKDGIKLFWQLEDGRGVTFVASGPVQCNDGFQDVSCILVELLRKLTKHGFCDPDDIYEMEFILPSEDRCEVACGEMFTRQRCGAAQKMNQFPSVGVGKRVGGCQVVSTGHGQGTAKQPRPLRRDGQMML